MSESINYEKLAGILNRASAQGKSGFCRMLWGNQSEAVQSQLLPYLSEQAQDAVSEKD
ncbi:hypothetical protein PN498_26165 [Oscillatoria sp. CS-180]|uniref:hypothetical protein n=1 Tax=Oscillatoria sp. CS-180 TaxID=3021720 RepID=UPI00232FABC0|nr:hypothetical protein [Oscillatoria sp. CS-180]MDB9529503.1 hypothetical protein [Oscillatoria sp. CS-180]